MPDSNSTGRNSDDLDLVHLVSRIFSFFNRYAKLIVICTLSGMFAGFLLYKLLPKQYASSMLLHSYMLSNTEQIRIIENWNALLKDGEYKALSDRLHCSESILQKVNKIGAAEIQKLYIPNNPNGFMVQVTVQDNGILDSLGKGIRYGLENSDYVSAKLSSRRSTLVQLIDKVRSEITKLDSTKKNIEHSINSNGQRTNSFIVDVSTINSQMIGLNEKLLGYQDELKFTNAVQVLQEFERFEKPASPKLIKSVALGLIGGFAIGYFLSVYFYFRRRSMLHQNL